MQSASRPQHQQNLSHCLQSCCQKSPLQRRLQEPQLHSMLEPLFLAQLVSLQAGVLHPAELLASFYLLTHQVAHSPHYGVYLEAHAWGIKS
ncbi:unnamed protein product [Protopolystoma xenopodis]|uniref:Uncharacterized protein n=1 Tax=Protopolystoma xenopodis TaxID=117903 RepID=A0A448X8V7_9PLAT|nr:unnamed protein product [Protopolystoma xenopodis]